jgi:hypothetical protein
MAEPIVRGKRDMARSQWKREQQRRNAREVAERYKAAQARAAHGGDADASP